MPRISDVIAVQRTSVALVGDRSSAAINGDDDDHSDFLPIFNKEREEKSKSDHSGLEPWEDRPPSPPPLPAPLRSSKWPSRTASRPAAPADTSEREQNRDQMTADAARSSSSNTPRAETDPESRASETLPPRVAPPTVADTDTASAADSPPHQRGRKRKAEELDDDCPDATSEETDGSGGRLDADSDVDNRRPVQKNKKRCFSCNCRMDLATREIGKCKCEYIFCARHRLPEQHNCSFDHKEHCRQEARTKMVVLKKHVGTALRRLDSDS